MNVLVLVLFIASIWLIRKLAWNLEEGTDEQRERNPELNTKTVCSISGLMVLATITQPLEGKFFAKT